MVVDLQGVNYILTDPQIHSKDVDIEGSFNRYGEGNFGTEGMASFFATHECNSICAHLKLSSLSTKTKIKPSICFTKISKKSHITPVEVIKEIANMIELSCELCGSIFNTQREKFINYHQNGKNVYCICCENEIKKRIDKKCEICSGDYSYSSYWYCMIGMEPPKTCKNCKKKAVISMSEKKSS